MAGNNGSLELNSIYIDGAAAKAAALIIVREALEQVSEQLAEYIRGEIQANGNGSSIMKADAVSLVKSILREASYEQVIYEAGIDDAALAACANDFRVRVLVVLTGNTHSGPIVTKPGQATFAKHVRGPRTSPLTGKPGFMGPNPRVVPLPFFEQTGDITESAAKNSLDKVKSIFEEAVTKCSQQLSSGEFWNQFIRIGK